MISVPLPLEHPMSQPQQGASPTARFLAGEVPHGDQGDVRLGVTRFGWSVGAHAAAFLLIVVVMTTMPEMPAPANTKFDMPRDIVWLAQEGPGGGGGGGNKKVEPPQKAELPGKDKITVPVAKPPKLQAPEPPKDEPKPEQQMNIPAVTMSAGVQEIPGALSGLPSTGSLGSGTGTGAGPGTGSGLGPGSGGGTGGGVYRPGSGVTWPKLLYEKKPQYTADAMRAKIQGMVEVEALVLPDGSVGEVRITRSLDPTFGLDREALIAVRQWKFAPALKQGQPVPVMVPIELTFTLR
jgi:periplasmic protein TonB